MKESWRGELVDEVGRKRDDINSNNIDGYDNSNKKSNKNNGSNNDNKNDNNNNHSNERW